MGVWVGEGCYVVFVVFVLFFSFFRSVLRSVGRSSLLLKLLTLLLLTLMMLLLLLLLLLLLCIATTDHRRQCSCANLARGANSKGSQQAPLKVVRPLEPY